MDRVPTVRDIMAEAHFSLLPTASAFEAIDALAAKKLSGVPVIDEEDRLVGFLTEKDCLRLQVVSHQYNMTGRTVRDIMSKIKEALRPDQDILSASMTFLSCHFGELPVIDGDTLVGTLRRQSMVQAIQRMHRELGIGKKNDKIAQKLQDNPSSIEDLQSLVSKSNRAQLASVFGRRHSGGSD